MATGGLLDRDQLAAAWDEVLKRDRQDGVLSAAIARFEADADARLDRLADQFATGDYRPADLTRVTIPKGDGVRLLDIPPVRDRVVERAVLELITPLVDPHLGPASFAYRPGLGVSDAVQAVCRLREEGLRFALRTDIDECFPTVPVSLVVQMLAGLVADPGLLALIGQLLARGARTADGGHLRVSGLAQGCAISPLLANLVLTHLDGALLGAGFPVVRYCDDLVVAVSTPTEAWEAARVAGKALEGLGMALEPDKTEVMSFADGFCFLGEDFGARYPPTLDRLRVDEPEHRVLYVGLQGSRVRVRGGRVQVETSDDVVALDVPSGHVSRIVCFGSVGVSAGARSWALGSGVDVVFASRRGSYQGHLVAAAQGARVGRLRQQLAFTADGARTVPLGRAIVAAKISKQIVVLQRFNRREHAEMTNDAIEAIRRVEDMLADCTTMDEVRGMEGAAAREYFPAYGALFPEDLRFQLRSRQPPLDLSNSALSFLYTVLLGECVTALRAAGLEPAIGVLHADQDNRPSLALDLLEELRPLIVDQVVLAESRRRVLRPEHARVEEGRPGVMLTKAGRAALLDAFELRMLQTTRGAIPGFSGTLRRHIYRQAQRMAATFTGATGEWAGMSWR
jgi:CRISPR-associated protein Cas1